MGQQIVNAARIDQQPFTGSGQTVTFTLPRQYDVERYYLDLSAVFNVTTAAGALKTAGMWNFIRRIELIASGQTVLRSITGTDLAGLASYMHRADIFNSRQWRQDPTAGVGANGARILLPLDLAFPDMLKPKDTNLRAQRLATLEIKVTLGSEADVFIGGAFGATTGTITVFADNVLEIPIAGSNQVSTPPYLAKITQIDVSTATANANFQQRLPVGNTIRMIMLTQKVAGDTADPGNQLILPRTKLLNNFSIQRGTDLRVFQPFDLMRANYTKMAQVANNITFQPFAVYDFSNRGAPQRGKITDGFRIDGSMDLNAVLDFPATTGGVITMTIVEMIAAAVTA
jgi:hypothetical protein